MSANAVAQRAGVGYARTLKLLHELEAAGQVRRSGARRSTVWQLITDEDRIAHRAAELERLRSTPSRRRGTARASQRRRSVHRRLFMSSPGMSPQPSARLTDSAPSQCRQPDRKFARRQAERSGRPRRRPRTPTGRGRLVRSAGAGLLGCMPVCREPAAPLRGVTAPDVRVHPGRWQGRPAHS